MEGKNAPMRRLLASGPALALAVLAVTTFAKTPAAQTPDRVLEACEPGKQEIDARALPATVEPGECPAGGRSISDGPVGSVVPPPGQTVYAEVLTTSGAEELSVRRLPDGTIRLDHVGEEPGESAGGDLGRAVDREGCYRDAYTDYDHKVTERATYNFRVSTTPRDLSRGEARDAITRAARNVFDTRNGCRMGDRVPAALEYGGRTGAPAQVGDGLCGENDGRSVVAFGDLKGGVVAAACTISGDRPNYPYDEVLSADIKINRADHRWTTSPNSRSCSRAYDAEAVMTHEWGHVFGLGHVSESGNRNLTMSPAINGPCQAAEGSLGRGDVLGLDGKY